MRIVKRNSKALFMGGIPQTIVESNKKHILSFPLAPLQCCG